MELEKIFFDADFEPSTLYPSCCPRCSNSQKSLSLRFWFVNEDESLYKCENPSCLYPFREFVFKNHKDNTLYRYRMCSREYSGVSNFSSLVKKQPEYINVDKDVLENDLSLMDFDTIANLSGFNDLSCSEDSKDCVDFDLDALLGNGDNSSDNHIEESIKKWLEDTLNQEKNPKPKDSQETLAPKKLIKSISVTENSIKKPFNLPIKKQPEVSENKLSPLEFLKKANIIKTAPSGSTYSFNNTKVSKNEVLERREVARMNRLIDEEIMKTSKTPAEKSHRKAKN